MSHAAPTFCMNVPMFDTIPAIHSQRNTVMRSGAHADCGATSGTANSFWAHAGNHPSNPTPRRALSQLRMRSSGTISMVVFSTS